MVNETLISVEGLFKYYGDYCAVRDVSFNLNRGEVLGFLGPNGAGKSTTMQIISGVLAADRGRALIAGADITKQPMNAKSYLGFLPEQPPLYEDLTVDEYLSYAARLRGLVSERTTPAIEQAKRRCGLSGVGRRLLRNLSKGFQQRAGIAQAIIHLPAVIILDEPTSGLDPIQIREIRALIRELGKDHGVILSTHILPEVQSVCDRVLIIDQGELVLDEPVRNLGSSVGGRLIRASFRNPPNQSELMSLPHLCRAEAIDESSYLIEISNEQGIDPLLARSLESGWGLIQFQPASDSLEEIFTGLVAGRRHQEVLPS